VWFLVFHLPPSFTRKFVRLRAELCNPFAIKKTNYATPRHQQTNGQAEIQVRIVKKVLRKYADYDATNWSRLLHLVEFSLNNSVNTSTGYSPFYLFFGFEPRVFPEENLVRKSNPTANLLATIGAVLVSAKKHIASSQAEMVVRYNRNRKEALLIYVSLLKKL
jgi:hypothetical protein